MVRSVFSWKKCLNVKHFKYHKPVQRFLTFQCFHHWSKPTRVFQIYWLVLKKSCSVCQSLFLLWRSHRGHILLLKTKNKKQIDRAQQNGIQVEKHLKHLKTCVKVVKICWWLVGCDKVDKGNNNNIPDLKVFKCDVPKTHTCGPGHLRACVHNRKYTRLSQVWKCQSTTFKLSSEQ